MADSGAEPLSRAARGFRQPRCSGCGLTPALCVCALWPPLAAPVQISVVMPPSEARSASGSARLLALWLPHTELYVRGNADLPEPAALLARPGSAVLFPGGARTAAPPSSFEHLIVPDGTWSQARRIERRWLAPRGLPRLELSPGWPSVYGLRRGQRGLCTFEAVIIAIGLHRDAALAAQLLDRFVEWSRRAQSLKAGGTPAASFAGAARAPAARAPERHPASARLLDLDAARPRGSAWP